MDLAQPVSELGSLGRDVMIAFALLVDPVTDVLVVTPGMSSGAVSFINEEVTDSRVVAGTLIVASDTAQTGNVVIKVFDTHSIRIGREQREQRDKNSRKGHKKLGTYRKKRESQKINPPENSQLKEETQSVVVCRSSLRLFAVKLVIHTDVDLLSGLGKLVLSESELLLAASGSFCLSLPGSARGSQGSLSALRWLLFFGKLIRPHCLAGS